MLTVIIVIKRSPLSEPSSRRGDDETLDSGCGSDATGDGVAAADGGSWKMLWPFS